MTDDRPEDEAIELPIDGELDLHVFAPRDVPSLVSDYLDECRARGILHVRIVHGKGIGALRETVHRVLERRPDVLRFRLDSETASGWGATRVDLNPQSLPPPGRTPGGDGRDQTNAPG